MLNSHHSAERLQRIEKASNLIVHYPPSGSFRGLIDASDSLLDGFRLVYATDNIESEFNGVSLADIEVNCPSLARFFSGTGLLFHSTQIYEETLRSGEVQIPIDYSVGFDTQVAEAFRLYEAGKTISDWHRFSNLIQYVTRHNFNFDYSFYIIEDLIHAADLKNTRPFNTVRALKRFDSVDRASLLENPIQPVFTESKEDAGRRACDSLAFSLSSDEIKRSLVRRKALLAVLLKATYLFWTSRPELMRNLSTLINFSLDHLGRFAKLELYFAWKLIKYGEGLRFFAPICQPSEVALSKLNGMSWDLYSIRHQETMASLKRKGAFFVPFFATLDRRLKELRDACPIRCLLIDDQEQRLNTIFTDELEFLTDVNAALDVSTNARLRNLPDKMQRLSRHVVESDIERLLGETFNECQSATT
jgi:hypothetical protein